MLPSCTRAVVYWRRAALEQERRTVGTRSAMSDRFNPSSQHNTGRSPAAPNSNHYPSARPEAYCHSSSRRSCSRYPSALTCIFALSNTLPFTSEPRTSTPGKAPWVLSKSNGRSAIQIFMISSGGRGIMFGIDHMNEKDVVPRGRSM